ncbi:MAG: hypothetical protein KBD37_00415 [Burkholderiales bacterium]|nr:hypothetical protein [Burkholderiales bacterium]
MRYIKWATYTSIILSSIISIMLSYLNIITFTLVPTSTTAKPLVLIENNTANFWFNPNVKNTITLGLSSIPLPLHIANSNNTPVLDMNISQIDVKNIFDKDMFHLNFKIHTLLQEFIKLSSVIPVTINHPPRVHNGLKMFAGIWLLVGVASTIFFSLSYFLLNKILPRLLPWLNGIEDKQINSKIWYLINMIFLLSAVGVSIWASFCGVLFGDDGFSLLMAKFPQDVLVATSGGSYYKFTHLLFRLVDGNIVLFRAVTLVLNCCSIVFLTYAFKLIFKTVFNRYPDKIQLLCIFSLLYITSSFQFIHNITPDYNNLSRYVVFAQISLLFLIFFSNRNAILILILGIVSGINFMVRMPEFICSILIIIILLKFVKLGYIRSIGILMLGIMLTIAIYFCCIQSVPDFINGINNGLTYLKIFGGHDPIILLQKNLIDIFKMLLQLAICLIIYHYIRTLLHKHYSVKAIILFAILLISLINILYCLLHYRDLTYYFIITSKLLMLILAILVYENIVNLRGGAYGAKSYLVSIKHKFITINMISILLLMFLYIASVGTDTKILYHIMFNVTLLYIGILLQLFLLSQIIHNWGSFYSTVLFLAFTAMIIFIKGMVWNSPQYYDLTTQRIKYNVSGTDLYIDKDAMFDLQAVKNTLTNCGYKEGDFIGGYYILPHIIFAVGGRSMVTPWYTYGDKYYKNTADRANQYIMSLTSPHGKLFLLIDKKLFYDGLGFDLNSDYYWCGTAQLSGRSSLLNNSDGYWIYRRY